MEEVALSLDMLFELYAKLGVAAQVGLRLAPSSLLHCARRVRYKMCRRHPSTMRTSQPETIRACTRRPKTRTLKTRTSHPVHMLPTQRRRMQTCASSQVFFHFHFCVCLCGREVEADADRSLFLVADCPGLWAVIPNSQP